MKNRGVGSQNIDGGGSPGYNGSVGRRVMVEWVGLGDKNTREAINRDGARRASSLGMVETAVLKKLTSFRVNKSVVDRDVGKKGAKTCAIVREQLRESLLGNEGTRNSMEILALIKKLSAVVRWANEGVVLT